MNSNLKTVGIAVLSSIATIGGFRMLGFGGNDVIFNEASKPSLARLANYDGPAGVPGDFTYAAELTTPSVVHIKAKSIRAVSQQRSIFDDFFGGDSPFGQFGQPRSQQQESSGSGVIITNDGFIATNNHVVEGATELEVVTADHKSYTAKIVGTDPSTDIAVIKVEGTKLPAITFANSDNVRVGEWVLAVGNPFNLESTVTAGIVSAKGRSIGILSEKQQQQMYRRYGEDGRQRTSDAIESFIQTDAAVNPGNSGGALVNLKGELIGINTAIASPNGAYAGYAFAVPSEIVKKVTADIVKYGNVQRGYLGINLVELDSKKAEELKTKTDEGIYVADVVENGAAKAAGIQKGDVIVKVDGIETKSGPKLQEMIGRKRPGESTKVTVNRNGSLKEYEVTLRNRDGGKDIVKNTVVSENKLFEQLGIELSELSSSEKQRMGIQNGVIVKKIYEGDIADYTQMREGFVIMKVGDKRINSANDFKAAIKAAKENEEEGVMICGTYQSSSRTTCYGISLE
ncbi:protease Do [Emticicia oligotrophica DSM 17448]|uniref:Protease Do n=1 Tax=Emticicia oligotrophica (strain DSM 17448 / CIP 109782 / MTCC 6937 / GPTSA100-15) TaxID=929562 RepID=A0ABM5N158_EMTOG|nr:MULTISPECIES: Do family serine endopeptidase [Emticicia]AFK03130.1 protease Do [Emticicia oligotrophica DSM 17448]